MNKIVRTLFLMFSIVLLYAGIFAIPLDGLTPQPSTFLSNEIFLLFLISLILFFYSLFSENKDLTLQIKLATKPTIRRFILFLIIFFIAPAPLFTVPFAAGFGFAGLFLTFYVFQFIVEIIQNSLNKINVDVLALVISSIASAIIFSFLIIYFKTESKSIIRKTGFWLTILIVVLLFIKSIEIYLFSVVIQHAP